MQESKRVDAARSRLANAEAKVKAAYAEFREALIDSSPLKVGDLIEIKQYSRAGFVWAGPFRIHSIGVEYTRLCYTYNEKKKDGTWGIRAHRLYGEWRNHEDPGV